MRLSKILKSKRGVALENTLVFMLIIFAICTLLTSLTLIGHYQVEIEKLSLEREVFIDQIGEDFLAWRWTGEEFDPDAYDNYKCTFDDNSLKVERIRGKKTMLIVKLDDNKNVIEWRYS